MAWISTPFGRFNDAPGPDPLEGLLADADRAAARQRRRGPPLPQGPTRGASIFGAGRLGSWSGLLLGQAAVPVRIADRDVLESRNLQSGNCPYRASDIGLPKVVAFHNLLRQQAPGILVEAVQADLLLLSEEEFVSLTEGAGVALGLVDDGPVLFRINRLLYRRLPVVYAAGHQGARTGDILITRPGTACLECILNINSPDQIRTLAGESTHGIDVVAIAKTCAKIALALLGDTRLGDAREVLSPGANFLFIENRLSPGNPGNLALQSLRIERRPTCPVCGAL
jgi:molybdopterin/thiamine biosynthesis adenylyltransferase